MTTTPFRDLLNTEGVREVCHLRGRLGFMAFHGGSLENLTDVVAEQAAARSEASYYGVLQPPDLNWHIPSHRVSPAESPTLAAFVEHVEVVITVHGYGRHGFWTTLLLGGQNRQLADHLAGHLRPHLPDYHVETDLQKIPKELRGMHEQNPVNLPAKQGVQIELPPRVRGASPVWKDWQGPGLVPHTESLINALAAAATTWPSTAPPSRLPRT
ncbi:MAG: poly-gamma-glutamate hydrolase family protein [Actinomycetota bacterium]|nr:poly-gamma-glutamate hydrolase family protein [Actinomycetota bacterium]